MKYGAEYSASQIPIPQQFYDDSETTLSTEFENDAISESSVSVADTNVVDGIQCIATHDFLGDPDQRQITFKKGDRLYAFEKDKSGWVWAETESGDSGYCPGWSFESQADVPTSTRTPTKSKKYSPVIRHGTRSLKQARRSYMVGASDELEPHLAVARARAESTDGYRDARTNKVRKARGPPPTPKEAKKAAASRRKRHGQRL